MTAAVRNINRTLLREPPKVDARFSSLMEQAQVIEGASHEDGGGLYTSLHEMTAAIETSICTPGSKTFQAPQIVTGHRFATQLGVTCKAPGGAWPMLYNQLGEVERLIESRSVEQAFMADVFAGATDITPVGGPVDAKIGVAMLEGHAAANYAGLPFLHLPLTIGSVLLGVGPRLELIDDTYRTPLGAPLVMGAGYENNLSPTGGSPAAGTMWIYATGVVTIERSAPREVPPQLDRATNDMTALIERIYVADVDTYKAAVRVNIK